jgi:hypothetical protein
MLSNRLLVAVSTHTSPFLAVKSRYFAGWSKRIQEGIHMGLTTWVSCVIEERMGGIALGRSNVFPMCQLWNWRHSVAGCALFVAMVLLPRIA